MKRSSGPSRAPIPTPRNCSITSTRTPPKAEPCPLLILKPSARDSGKRWNAIPTCS
jgi:hypothetical protein